MCVWEMSPKRFIHFSLTFFWWGRNLTEERNGGILVGEMMFLVDTLSASLDGLVADNCSPLPVFWRRTRVDKGSIMAWKYSQPWLCCC
jgi:hypothetical protein